MSGEMEGGVGRKERDCRGRGGGNGVVREEMVYEEGDGILRKEIDVRTV